LKKILYILVFIFNSILCVAQSGIRVNLINTPKRISPGSYFNLIFDVESSNTFSEPLTVSLKIPDTWEILSQNEPEIIIGEKKIKYIFSVNTSMFSPPGTNTSRLLINTASGYRIEKPFQIQVVPVRKIIISPILLPESAKEGDSLKVEYLVENRGNVKDNLKLEALGGKIVGKTEISELNPDESTRIFANFIIPEGEENSFNFGFGIRATLKDSLKPVNFTNSILVYSKKIKKTELYNRFPVSVGFMGNIYFKNKKVDLIIQPEISGNGYIDKNQRHYLDFNIIGPNRIISQNNNPNIFFYDQYNLRYKYNKNKFMSTVQIGDYNLEISQLIENGRFGRGFNYEARYNKIGIYSFYIQPRFFPQQRQTFGGRLYFIPNTKLRLSVDYTSKYFQINRFVWVNLVGVSSVYKSEKFNIASEIVGSLVSKKYDFGLATRFDYSIRKIKISGNNIYAGKEFYGFYRNSYLISTLATRSLTKKLFLGINTNISRLNANRDSIFFKVSPYMIALTGSINYKINSVNNINTNYTWAKVEDRLEPKRFFYQQQFIQLGYDLNGKRINISYQGRLGKAKNFLAIEDSSIEKQNIFNNLKAEYRVLPWAWAGLLFQQQRTNRFSVLNQLTDMYFYGATLRANLKNILNTELFYMSNYAPDQINDIQNTLMLNATLNLGKHRLQLTSGKRIVPSINSPITDDLYFILRYSYLLNAPTSRKKNLGNIQGLIGLSSEGLKKDGIVITLGDKKFISDKDGKFLFKNLVADKYYLDIDQKSLPKGVITNLKLPLEVDVKGDSTSQINLTLTKTGTIVGKVLFTNIENDEDSRKPSVLIKVSNDTETFYTRVNKNDEFSCKQVKPGKWSITASINGGNPEDYTITDATQSIEVEADGSLEVEFTIENYKKTIEFSPSTFNLIEEKEIKISSVPKENSSAKENNISKENSAAKENNISKENSVSKENNISKENSTPKENNINKENSVTKENNISKEDNVSKENDDTWTNKISPSNKTKPKTTPKTKSIVKDVNQRKNTNNNNTKKQSLRKKPNYTIISI
jgi:hypothetical protein